MKNKQQEIIFRTEKFVHDYFKDEVSGHDWWHVQRVRNYSLKIAKKEGGNLFIIEMAALLHDLDDWKLNTTPDGSKTKGWLNKLNIDTETSLKILEIIDQVSFKGAGVKIKPTTDEAKIVQDADRLDAMGAIGIARTFAYGGSKGRLIYHPGKQPEFHDDFESYRKNTAPTINHFYEKLLLLKERMNTTCGREMAEIRHRFMVQYLEQFFNEWESKI